MAANRTSGLVLLSRTLTDHFTTPTASTFAASRSGSHDYACDEGDILDDLVGPAPPRPRLRGPALHDEDEDEDGDEDDNVSTCSSVTAGGNDDRSSVSSRGRSRFSDTTSVTSISESGSIAPPKVVSRSLASNTAVGANAGVGNGGGGGGGGGKNGRRRRRRNNRGQSSVAASETASETAYETASVADSVAPSVLKGRNNNNINNKARNAKPTSLRTDGSSRASKNAKTGRSSSPAPVARRGRNSTKGSYSREATTRDNNNSSSNGSNNKPRRSRHPRLIIGLDLDAELELKSKVQGDICLTLVMEEEAKRAPRPSPELRLKKASDGRLVAVEDDENISEYTSEEDEDEDRHKDEEDEENSGDERENDSEREPNNKLKGSTKKAATKRSKERQPNGSSKEPKLEPSVTDDGDKHAGYTRKGRREICHMRIGCFNLSRRWWMDGFELVGRVPPPVIVFVVATLPVAGFAAGWAASAQWSAGTLGSV